jgi:hypothetical protein
VPETPPDGGGVMFPDERITNKIPSRAAGPKCKELSLVRRAKLTTPGAGASHPKSGTN